MNNYKMGVEGLLILTNVVLGTLSTSYKCNQKVNKTSIKWSEYSEGQLHMLQEGKDNIALEDASASSGAGRNLQLQLLLAPDSTETCFESCG